MITAPIEPRQVEPGAVPRWLGQGVALVFKHPAPLGFAWCAFLLVHHALAALPVSFAAWSVVAMPVGLLFVLAFQVLLRALDGANRPSQVGHAVRWMCVLMGMLALWALDSAVISWLQAGEGWSVAQERDWIAKCLLSQVLLTTTLGLHWPALCLFQGASACAALSLEGKGHLLNIRPMAALALMLPATAICLSLAGAPPPLLAIGFIIWLCAVYAGYIDIYEHRRLCFRCSNKGQEPSRLTAHA